jgi:hypothetical protein
MGRGNKTWILNFSNDMTGRFRLGIAFEESCVCFLTNYTGVTAERLEKNAALPITLSRPIWSVANLFRVVAERVVF